MRILVSRGLYGDHLGGAETEIIDFSKLLAEHGHSVYLMTNSHELKNKGRFSSSKYIPWPRSFKRIVRVFLTPIRYIRFYRQIISSVKQMSPDLAVCESKEDGIILSLTKKRHGLPVIWRDHADLRHHLKLSRKNLLANMYQSLLVRALNRVDSIATVSQYDSEHISKFIGKPEKVAVIHPGIVAAKKDSKRHKAKSAIVTIGTITRLVEDKGVQYIIRAATKLHRSPFKLAVIGDGPYRNELEDIANKLGVDCEFRGYSEIPFEEYGNFDIFVQPSRYEGWSKTVIESMWHGVPVIASNIPCHGEQIKDGETGLLFRSGDPSDLAEKLQRLIDDQNLRENMGKAAAESARDFGDFSKIFEAQFLPLIVSVARTDKSQA